MKHVALPILLCVALPASMVLVRSEPPAKLTSAEVAQRQQHIGDDPVRLLELCPLADEETARQLRATVGKLLLQTPPIDRPKVAHDVAAVLGSAAPTPEDMRQLLGAPQTVSRQIVYRRCLEQWTYSYPLPLCLVWITPHGEETRLQSVHVANSEKQ